MEIVKAIDYYLVIMMDSEKVIDLAIDLKMDSKKDSEMVIEKVIVN